MASISKQPNGRRTIQFVGADKKRRSIRLGKVSQRDAEAIKVKVERLVAASISGHPADDETLRWVAGLEGKLRARLERAGLIQGEPNVTLDLFVRTYIASRGDLKPSTRDLHRLVHRNLVEYFGYDKRLQDITLGDADGWRQYLVDQGLADNTVRRRCGIAKQFMTAAVRQEVVDRNPFADLKVAVRPNISRFHFVDRSVADRVLQACPDSEWRLLFALSRFGGLRCPSEHLTLRWSDIDWGLGRITVRSPKTEHHPGGETRAIPLFPELRPYLEDAFHLAKPGTEYVISRYRDCNANLRTQLTRIIRRAGLKPWPKLFQNLRSTRETELAEQFPLHAVCAWMGNSQPVAAKHYLQVTDEHFQRAASEAAGQEAVHNPVQQARVPSRNASQKSSPTNKETLNVQEITSLCSIVNKHTAVRLGLEPRLMEPESIVLPITPSDRRRSLGQVGQHRRARSTNRRGVDKADTPSAGPARDLMPDR